MGLEVLVEVENAFILPHNNAANIEKSGVEFIQMLTSPAISRQVTDFCMSNCGGNLPLFKSPEGQAISQNFDFLLRFWKSTHYHSVAL